MRRLLVSLAAAGLLAASIPTPALADGTAPGPPTIVSAVPIGAGRITVSWTAGTEGGAPGAYYLTWRLKGADPCDFSGGAGDFTLTYDATATSGTAFGLTSNGSPYCLAVRAENTYGTSAWAVTIATPVDKPSQPPAWIPAGGFGNGTITIHWSPAYDGGLAITEYHVYVGTTSGGEVEITGSPFAVDSPAILHGSLYWYTLTGLLTDGTTYYIYVTAENGMGEGTPSPEVHAVPVLAPATPTGVTATGTALRKATVLPVTVTWSDGSTAGVLGHTIIVWEYTAATRRTPESYSPVSSVTATGTGTSYTFTSGLSRRTTYAFTVQTRNAAGLSSESDYSNFVTLK